MWPPRTACFAWIALTAAACSPDVVPIAPSSNAELPVHGQPGSPPEIVVVVADDAATAEGVQLRDQVVQSLRAGLLNLIDMRWGPCGSSDPAEWHAGDVQFVIARPSAPDDSAVLTPVEMPALRWITQTSKAEEIDAVIAGVTDALGKRLAAPGEVYRPLRAATRTLELVTGQRAPESAAEAAFAATLPAGAYTELIIASTRDDEEIAAVEQFVLSDASLSQSTIQVFGPFTGDTFGGCEVSSQGQTRLQAWSELAFARRFTWPCDVQRVWDELLFAWSQDCLPYCQSRPIAVSADGRAECSLVIDQPDLGSCDSARGWRDPGGKATFVDRYGMPLRRCEIVQLEGAHLDLCQHSLDCPGCPSGFCVTELPELVEPTYCAPDYHWPLRFIGGAVAANPSWLGGVCITAEGN